MKKVFYAHCIVLLALLCSTIACMDQENGPKNVLKDLGIQSAIGAMTGIAEVSVDQPLVRIKNMLQQNQKTSEIFKNKRAFWHIFKTLYAGYGANAGSMAPITAVQVASNHFIKGYLSNDGTKNLVLHEKVSAAFLGGMLSGFVSSPAECIMLHQQNSDFSMKQAIKEIVKGHGGRALYRGLFPIALRDGGFSVGYLVLSNAVAQSIPRSLPIDLDNPLVQAFVGGIPAGVLAAIATHPCDMISTLMKSDLTATKYPNTLVTLTMIIKTNGVKGIFSGLLPRMMRVTMAIPLMTLVASGLQELVNFEQK